MNTQTCAHAHAHAHARRATGSHPWRAVWTGECGNDRRRRLLQNRRKARVVALAVAPVTHNQHAAEPTNEAHVALHAPTQCSGHDVATAWRARRQPTSHSLHSQSTSTKSFSTALDTSACPVKQPTWHSREQDEHVTAGLLAPPPLLPPAPPPPRPTPSLHTVHGASLLSASSARTPPTPRCRRRRHCRCCHASTSMSARLAQKSPGGHAKNSDLQYKLQCNQSKSICTAIGCGGHSAAICRPELQ
jgi:hypothetical protein